MCSVVEEDILRGMEMAAEAEAEAEHMLIEYIRMSVQVHLTLQLVRVELQEYLVPQQEMAEVLLLFVRDILPPVRQGETQQGQLPGAQLLALGLHQDSLPELEEQVEMVQPMAAAAVAADLRHQLLTVQPGLTEGEQQVEQEALAKELVGEEVMRMAVQMPMLEMLLVAAAAVKVRMLVHPNLEPMVGSSSQ